MKAGSVEDFNATFEWVSERMPYARIYDTIEVKIRGVKWTLLFTT